jgi:hypothetical protein
MTTLTIAMNTDATQDLAYGTSGVDWVDFDAAADYILFSAGTAGVVADGEDLPTVTERNQAGMVITGSEQEVTHYFLADNSDDELKEMFLAGNKNKRYVFAFDFDGATSSEPVLEVWDDTDLDSITNHSLGAGTASSSWIRGITTTAGLPGADWVGSRLAGAASGNYLNLNNGSGALSGATTLYCQLKVIVPASYNYSGAETPVFVVKYTTS